MAAHILTTYIDTEYIRTMELLLRKHFTRFRVNMAVSVVVVCFFRFACQMANSCVRSWTGTRHWVSSGRTFLGRLKIRPTAILDSCRSGYTYAHSGVLQMQMSAQNLELAIFCLLILTLKYVRT